MKHKLTLIILGVLLTLFTACSPAEVTNATGTDTSNSTVGDNPTGQPLSTSSAEAAKDTNQPASPIDSALKDKLAAGTLMLEGTELAVTQEEAQTLLVLWKGIDSLTGSETVSQTEIDAIYQQIQESMTSQQLAAIEETEIDPGSLRQTLADMGLQMGRMNGNRTENSDSAAQEGQMPPGGMEMGMLGGPGGTGEGPGGAEGRPQMQGTPSSEMATAIAERQAAGGLSPNSMFIKPLIQLLEQRASS